MNSVLRVPGLFRSFLMGGFEGSTHRTFDRRQLDLIAATGHDSRALADYRLLASSGLQTARDALRWHLIEAKPGRYDWSSFLPMLRAAVEASVEVIWDLCHYGVPTDIDIWSPEFPARFAEFCAAAARLVASESSAVPFYCPMNEIFFWAWAGGEHGRIYPYATGRGAELKRVLAGAAIAAVNAVRSVDPRARFVQAEPLINVLACSSEPGEHEAAEGHRQAQYEACDMLGGRIAPELGGSPAHLDIIGLNFYHNNQWFRSGSTIAFGDIAYRPLRSMLLEVFGRYRRPMLLTETGSESPNGAGWLRYVGGEVRAALRDGVPVEGICLYPIMDYPGWENDRHCSCGLIRTDATFSTRTLDQDLLDQVHEEQYLLAWPMPRRPPPPQHEMA